MSKRNRLAAIILAAGKGTRMQSPLAKVLHPILGKPMLVYPIACAKVAGSQEVVVVVGHQAETIKEDMKDAKVTFIDQREQLGTGHAVMMAREHFQGFRGTILILCRGSAPEDSDDRGAAERAPLRAGRADRSHNAPGGPIRIRQDCKRGRK